MNDETLYTQILGLETPWIVTDVTLDITTEEVLVKIEYNSPRGSCPTCQKECSIHDKRASCVLQELNTILCSN